MADYGLDLFSEDEDDEIQVVENGDSHTSSGSAGTKPFRQDTEHEKVTLARDSKNLRKRLQDIESQLSDVENKIKRLDYSTNNTEKYTSGKKTTSNILFSDSDNENSCSPKKWNRFTESDRIKIVDYMIEKNLQNEIGLRSPTWTRMLNDVDFREKRHTVESLHTHFRKQILPKLRIYVKDEKERRKFATVKPRKSTSEKN